MPIKTKDKLHAMTAPLAEYAWLTTAPQRGETYLEIRISRKMLIAVIASLLIHGLFLFFFKMKNVELDMRPVGASDNTLSVQLSPPSTAPAKAPAAPPTPHAEPQRHTVKSKPQRQAVMTRPASSTPPPFTIPTAPPAPPPADTTNAAPTDMSSYINAVRARRNAESGATTEGPPQPSADDARMANIKRNLQQGGGGVFQIMRVGSHTATFLFRGWGGNTYTSPLQETITVEADANTDVEHAIIRKMIGIIRARHNGDFTWESRRLNRVVTLSARLEDNAGLEDFMMREFFDAGRRPAEQY